MGAVDPNDAPVPSELRAHIRRRPGLIPIRYEQFPHEAKWRAVPNLEHSTLCRAFSLDPCSHWFELPRTALGTGSNRVGAGRGPTGRRVVDGFVFRGPKGSEPIGKLTVAWESEKFRERDPNDRTDFYRLGGG